MAQKNNSKNRTSNLKNSKVLKWYILIPLAIIVWLIGNLIYKGVMTKYDIGLLDKAEVKLRALGLPKADKTTYQRTCSVRSVKFQDPGKPTCTLDRSDIYRIDSISQGSEITMKYFSIFKLKYTNSNPNFNNMQDLANIIEEDVSRGPTIDQLDIQRGLKCYASAGTTTDIPLSYGSVFGSSKNQLYLIANVFCSKKFQTQAYPEY